ncbi:hypothetical protein [Gracilimonas sp.]|uniref:hypothetical protein n=1 Tax=Gracilimonas sp. TaxID=1974203 RepID=UPI003D120130
MLRAVYLLLIVLFLPGCFVVDALECGYIFLNSDIGSVSTSPVPEQYVTLGDTVFFNTDPYWDYDYGCEGNRRTEPYLETFITNSQNVEFYRQKDYVFIIGKKTGRFIGAIVGSADIRRNDSNDLHTVFLPFNIRVVEEPVERGRQRAVFPKTGRIERLEILDVDPEFPRVRLLTHYSPLVENMNYTNFSSWVTLTPTLDLTILRKQNKYIYDLITHLGPRNEFYFVPENDTLQSLYHGYIEIIAEGRTFGKTISLDLSDYLN